MEPVALAQEALRARLDREIVKHGITDRRYNRGELASRISDVLRERAMRGELAWPLNLEPNQGSIWFHRGMVSMEMRG